MASSNKKRRVFYPKSEQTLGLFTTGKEWMDRETLKEYKGPYHRFSDGIVMTGASPAKGARYLTPFKDISAESIAAMELYRLRTVVKVDKYVAPEFKYPKIIQDDKSAGYIERYFVQSKSNRTPAGIIEIDKKQYDKCGTSNSKGIDGHRFDKLQFRWKIVGEKEEIEKTNKKTLLFAEQKYKGIRQYLADLTEFSQYSPIISD